MTEHEWRTSRDAAAMLGFRLDAACPVPPPSARKLRLVACACCRQAWGRLVDPGSRQAVEVAERYADGLATDEERNQAVTRERRWLWSVARGEPGGVEFAAISCLNDGDNLLMAPLVVSQTLAPLVPPAAQAALLRCVFGNPFRRLQVWRNAEGHPDGPGAGPLYDHRTNWLAWNGGAVRRLAEAAYGGEEQCRHCDRVGVRTPHEDGEECSCAKCGGSGTVTSPFDASRLPVLADALEEAGCTDQTILDHLRGPGPHGRGCWVIDLLLGK